jgi:hypothetical protein
MVGHSPRPSCSIIALLVGLVLVGCGDSGPAPEPTTVSLKTSSAPCASQQAVIPDSHAIALSLAASTAHRVRTNMADYVSYALTMDGAFLYLSFAPNLPAMPTTAELRGGLRYAYVDYRLEQPTEIGGSLTFLSRSDLLAVADFERLEVQNGAIVWRLVRDSGTRYVKWLSIYDEDRTNDPEPRNACILDDIVGECVCEFAGPSVRIALEGSIPL